MSPTPQELQVATGALRNEARTWTAEADTMGGLKTKIDGLEFGRVDAGIFQAIVDKHADLVHKLSGLCQEGSQRFEEVGSTLQICADTYDAEDAAGKHTFETLW
ncbi:hypothetical protein ACIBCN_39770 [Nocardia sp. NPDC051052]|uniref:hypothetical protein n=1 Tax=Nocardia sp. NPDC051052 TaxID=3364322 RepID=UPI00379B5491